ncbi:TetR/AcrR family transcriptional regulator [Streptomyces sp. NPDC004539]|uniref:TetR/AcrR family transcriptional regulator n=1 Tax=Streptomyces sp. NPDC004539 TaxID=3154280 RepID=UPI0033A60978
MPVHHPTPEPERVASVSRADLVADAAIALLAERGMRGLTHRAVDEAAGLAQGSTSNLARTRQALLELAVRRHAEREAGVLGLGGLPGPEEGVDALARALAGAVHRLLSEERVLVVARYELALEATRRAELREFYDATGARFREALRGTVVGAGSREPERHVLSLVAWADGLMFSCVAGGFGAPSQDEVRDGVRELLRGMLWR